MHPLPTRRRLITHSGATRHKAMPVHSIINHQSEIFHLRKYNMTRSLLGLAAVALLAAPAGAADPTTCGHGTKIDFVDSPKVAAALAKKQEKLVMVLHVSGHFEDPGLT